MTDEMMSRSYAAALLGKIAKLEAELAEVRAEATDSEFHRRQCFDNWQAAREENADLAELVESGEKTALYHARLGSLLRRRAEDAEAENDKVREWLQAADQVMTMLSDALQRRLGLSDDEIDDIAAGHDEEKTDEG